MTGRQIQQTIDILCVGFGFICHYRHGYDEISDRKGAETGAIELE